MIRDDLSEKLIHLTRGDTDQVAADAFLAIVREKIVRGGASDIRGGYRCVCFSEAPISKLAHILAAQKMRYRPFGLMVDKAWLFSKGGRPAIYQTNDEYELLHESQRFRHVRYEPNEGVDFTWEREWRIRADRLEVNPRDTTLVVPTRAWEKWFQDRHSAGLAIGAIVTGGFGLRYDFPWHFIVLEDLGVQIPAVEPPTQTGA